MADDTDNTATINNNKFRSPEERARNILGTIKAESIKVVENGFKSKVADLYKKRKEAKKALEEIDEKIKDAEAEFAADLMSLDN